MIPYERNVSDVFKFPWRFLKLILTPFKAFLIPSNAYCHTGCWRTPALRRAERYRVFLIYAKSAPYFIRKEFMKTFFNLCNY